MALLKPTANLSHDSRGESEYGPFVASKKRSHFHRPDCKWAEYLNERNSIEFGSHREAVEAGKRPCKTCCA
jgi:methylphosphotriester-DNA--protein-cysteine methyltransferase